MAETLEAGVARTVITPPIGIPMQGFAGRGPALWLHDDLTATALVLRSGATSAAIVSLDLCLINGDDVAVVQERIAENTGIAPANQAICASHTHYGPDLKADNPSPVVQRYRAELFERVVDVTRRAAATLRPVTLGHGLGNTEIGINRRELTAEGRIILGNNPTGPCDREVRVVRLDTIDGRPWAAIVNAACHPVCGGGRTRGISACWPGVARELFERETGARMVFLQGACGNINSIELREGFEVAERLGTQFGAEVLRVWRGTGTAPAAGLAVAVRDLELPRYTFGSRDRAETLHDDLKARLERLEPGADGARWWLERGLRQTGEVLAWYRGEGPLEPVKARVSGWRLGPVALATAPGEIFCEIGMAIKAHARAEAALFSGYTNGSIGYVPAPEAYPEGGYEVEQACNVDPPAAGLITQACVACLLEARAEVLASEQTGAVGRQG